MEPCIFSAEGDGERPAGVPIEVGIMKSSRFIASVLLFVVIVGVGPRASVGTDWSEAFRSCEMPPSAADFEFEVLRTALVGCSIDRFALERQIC
jgi:hypothetical protein